MLRHRTTSTCPSGASGDNAEKIVKFDRIDSIISIFARLASLQTLCSAIKGNHLNPYAKKRDATRKKFSRFTRIFIFLSLPRPRGCRSFVPTGAYRLNTALPKTKKRAHFQPHQSPRCRRLLPFAEAWTFSHGIERCFFQLRMIRNRTVV